MESNDEPDHWNSDLHHCSPSDPMDHIRGLSNPP